jgi:proteasome lid subunit RPN8/RPN11
MIPTPDVSIFDNGLNNLERCGVIVQKSDDSTYVVELPNRSNKPKLHFTMLKEDVRVLVLPEGDIIIGVIHTHPYRSVRTASQHDIDSIPKGLVGMVYHPSTGSTTWYDHTGVLQHNLRKRR